MNLSWRYSIWIVLLVMASCAKNKDMHTIEVFETSAKGNKFERLRTFSSNAIDARIQLLPDEKYQTITGFGGAFTEASAHVLNQLGKANRKQIMEAYFGAEGAQYSLTRTHINSCDFSLGNYSYAPEEGDMDLQHFSVDEDREDLIPMIREALEISLDGFKIIASPWTAPPWMKDNKKWVGGTLLPEFYDTWALYFTKYIDAYREEGIEIWGVTVENEPLGNGNNWESMHYTPQEMSRFVQDHLGPKLEERDMGHIKILGYDQNREHLEEWVDTMFANENSAKYFSGTAIHWYASTYEVFPDALQYAHEKAPDKYLIQTEACVDAEVPKWKDDAWYWSKEATDWGWDWAPEDQKYLHPKYVPVYRYARDIIGCLNNWVDGWVDWNMVLDKQGGPNWFGNWCVAPIIVDTDNDEVYYTPLYYTLKHFSRFIRPGAHRIGLKSTDGTLLATAAQNPDDSIVLVVLNQEMAPKSFEVDLGTDTVVVRIDGRAIQTVVMSPYADGKNKHKPTN